MTACRWWINLATALAFIWAPELVLAQVHHALRVTLDPHAHRLEVTDTVTLPEAVSEPVRFLLHQGLAPVVENRGAVLSPTRVSGGTHLGGVPVEAYEVALQPGERRFTVQYAGGIHHPPEQDSREYARSFSASPGIIGPEGVFLSAGSYWYPVLEDRLVTFDLEVRLPAAWRSVSQGRRTLRAEGAHQSEEAWRVELPQDQIYLVAAVFSEYRAPADTVEALVMLREPDAKLAGKYLDATGRYLAMYRALIGPYPYAKFALVENFWETGYGMPSFTLLGPKVIRFPFILHSSYPHEILHNWWGNSVYVNFTAGNWSEGLTSYLADHLIKEQRGQAVQYRRATLQKYADYVRDKQDFPLREFRGRHSSVTEAVGYGKTLMFFHMLRREIGDERFIAGLRLFYRRHRFRTASFDDLASSFTEAAGEPLEPFFDQWVQQRGAPSLRVRDVRSTRAGDEYVLTGAIEQAQPGPPYRVRVPVAVRLDGVEAAYQDDIRVDAKWHPFELRLSAPPTRLDVDPEFDVFRRLDRNEIPPAISQALGDDRVLFVLPGAASSAVQRGYEDLVRSWFRDRAHAPAIVRDADMTELPADRTVWLFGWENRFRPELARALAGYEFSASADTVRLGDARLERDGDVAVVLARQPASPEHALAWVAVDNLQAMPGLARKLPHYGKYSYLGFRGDEPTNVAKGQWPVLHSPMSVSLSRDAHAPPAAQQPGLAPRRALIEQPPVFSAERMMRDIRRLADPALEGRGLGTPGLERAAEYIAAEFRAAGLQPAGHPAGSFYQSWTADIGGGRGTLALRNVIGAIPGTKPEWSGQSVVVGAHYDHLGLGWPNGRRGNEGKVHPGADDNASGIAVMLELARLLANQPAPERSIIFAAFTGEESGKLGSKRFVEQANAYPTEGIMGMINLDTVGRLGERELLILGSASAREWVHIFRGAGFVTGVPVTSVEEALDASDQTSFIDAEVPAVQLFAGAHGDYHRPSDTADKIDAAGLVKIAAVLKEAVEYLAARPDALTAQGHRRQTQKAPPAQGRKVVLGTVPDFTYVGEGVRISAVSAQSPAARAGLREGDVIVAVNDHRVAGLRGYANILRDLDPGDPVTVAIIRDGETLAITTRVVAR